MDQIKTHTNTRMLLLMLLFLLVAVVRTNYGLWNTDIPLSDEVGTIDRAFKLFSAGAISSSMLCNVYIAVFKYVTTDPIIAHLYARFIASALSVFGLFLLLSSLPHVSVYGAFIMSLFWNISLLNTPVIQHNNLHVFTFAIACFAGFFWIITPRIITKLFSIVLLAMAVSMRPEYVLLLFLLCIQRLTFWIKQLKHSGWRHQGRLQLKLTAGVVAFFGVAFFLVHNASNLFSYIDRYLFLILQQCYTVFSAIRGNIPIDPMTEHDIVMNKQFPGASGFFDAVIINPIEVIRYCFLNVISNITHIYHLLTLHGIFLFDTVGTFGYYIARFENVTFALFIAYGSVWFIYMRMKVFNFQKLWWKDHVVFIFGLAAVSITPLMLIGFGPRYWIMLIPLLFWGPSSFISIHISKCSSKTAIIVSILLSLIIVVPIFNLLSNHINYTDKDLAMDFREKLRTVDSKQVKSLGYFPGALLTFAIPGRSIQTTNYDVRKGLSYKGLVESNEYDLVIVDPVLRHTYQYKSEVEFFNRFMEQPEYFGYRQILNSKVSDGQTCIFLLGSYKICRFYIYFGIQGNAEQYEQGGWSSPESGFTWTDGQVAELFIPLNKPQFDFTLYAQVNPFIVPGMLGSQRVSVLINGRKAGEWVVDAPGEYYTTIPKDYLNQCGMKLSFKLDDAASPADLGLSQDTRVLGLELKSIKILEE